MTEQNWRELFGFNLRNYLKYNNMAQQDLCDLTYLSNSTISDYINGRKSPNAVNLLKIAHALNCNVNDLADFGEMIE